MLECEALHVELSLWEADNIEARDVIVLLSHLWVGCQIRIGTENFVGLFSFVDVLLMV